MVDDGAHSSVGTFVELVLAAAAANGEPDPNESVTALVTCKVSVERTIIPEALRVTIYRPSGLGLQWGEAEMCQD